jgi:DNA helicase-2/ATP-dependent DNA helicase PcrA
MSASNIAALVESLNPPQQAAVTLPKEPALILAGAGSGKTRVLTTRIAWLISTGQVSPYGLLAVTFTNKAAREMLARLSAMLPVNLKGMWVGTFHGLCNRLLRAHHREAALPATFQILDSQDQLASIKRLMKAMGVDDEKYPPRQVQSFINSAKEQGLRPSAVDDSDGYNKKFVAIYQAYDEQCQREGVVDFGELLLRSVELLSRNTALRDHYRQRFSHVLIDEFQDTNPLQYQWLKQLSTAQTGVFAVGDDDQSIYAFRGADVANMKRFESEFGVQHLVKLEQNYRSHGHILDAANALIRNNTDRLGKNLWTDAGVGEPLRVMETASDLLEAHWLVDEIKTLVNEGSLRSEIAVLYRSNAQSRVIEQTLFNAGIPYKVYGGLRFFERAEIKHALAYLRLMENPHEDTAFLRVVNFPTRGIGARSIEQLSDLAKAHGTSLYAASVHLEGKAGVSVRGFVQMIESLRFETQGAPLKNLVELMLERSGLVRHFETEREGRERVENLLELVNAAAAFGYEEGLDPNLPANLGVSMPVDAGQPGQVIQAIAQADGVVLDSGDAVVPLASPLSMFLSHASLEAGDNQAAEGQDAVQLMTIHSAKGLEFNTVFITGLEEGLFPHENSAAELDGLSEERRLMYVAITRARRRLYLSMSQTRMLHGQTRYNMRSRFLEELPEGALKWLTPRLGKPAGSGMGGGASGYGATGGGSGSAYGGYGGYGSGSKSRGSSWADQDSSKSSRGGGYGRGADAPYMGGPAQLRGVTHDSGFQIGQAVRHAKFGDGVITALEGSGSDARAQVSFKREGSKWLALSVAKLDRI